DRRFVFWNNTAADELARTVPVLKNREVGASGREMLESFINAPHQAALESLFGSSIIYIKRAQSGHGPYDCGDAGQSGHQSPISTGLGVKRVNNLGPVTAEHAPQGGETSYISKWVGTPCHGVVEIFEPFGCKALGQCRDGPGSSDCEFVAQGLHQLESGVNILAPDDQDAGIRRSLRQSSEHIAPHIQLGDNLYRVPVNLPSLSLLKNWFSWDALFLN